MIRKKNIALVIDTNILGDIIENGNSDNVVTVLTDWTSKIISEMKKQPKGKKITVFTTTKTMKDYRTGLSRRGFKIISKTLSSSIEKSLSHKIRVPDSQKIDLSLRKIDDKKSKQHAGDRYDEGFFNLTNAIIQSEHWSDREIIFASRDRQLIQEIENFSNKVNSRIHVVNDLESFEQLIEC